MTCNQKNKSMEVNQKATQMLKLAENNLKIIRIIILKHLLKDSK